MAQARDQGSIPKEIADLANWHGRVESGVLLPVGADGIIQIQVVAEDFAQNPIQFALSPRLKMPR